MKKEDIIAYIGVVAGSLIENMTIDCKYKDLIPICIRTANEFWEDNISFIENAEIEETLKQLDKYAEEKLTNNFSDKFNHKEKIKKYVPINNNSSKNTATNPKFIEIP